MFKFSEFTIDEISQFYCVPSEGQQIPNNRPYSWSNTVSSLDGFTNFLEPGGTSSDIALKNSSSHEAAADFRLLNAGWAHSDAILISGKNLRDEPDTLCRVVFQDLLDYRVSVLSKPTIQPIQIILTNSGKINFHHNIFKKKLINGICDQKTLIFSSHEVSKNLQNELSKIDLHDVSVIGLRSNKFGVDLLELTSYLRISLGIKFLDVSGGGRIIQEMRQLELLDEIRLTLAGQICGPLSKLSIARPVLFPNLVETKSYTSQNSPLVEWVGIRMVGKYLIFLRVYTLFRQLSAIHVQQNKCPQGEAVVDIRGSKQSVQLRSES
ncbi:hypothetical protein HK096_011187 [Nowakowskiella sp. JEL0078]|nr:hypothetical protein HK096_011187 [Nowakowskiella sp. JEL0078]